MKHGLSCFVGISIFSCRLDRLYREIESCTCRWDATATKSWLVKGIALIAFVQIAGILREIQTDGQHGVGILYHVQWFGVYWIALAVYRRRDLESAGVASEASVNSVHQNGPSASADIAPNSTVNSPLFCSRCGTKLSQTVVFVSDAGRVYGNRQWDLASQSRACVGWFFSSHGRTRFRNSSAVLMASSNSCVETFPASS